MRMPGCGDALARRLLRRLPGRARRLQRRVPQRAPADPEFPWPPAEGWHPQATAFWTATGLIDTAIALLALYFVAAFFGGRRRALWAGLVSLATYMCTIFVFNYTVVATGAWAQHPVEYVVLNAATIPLVLLFAVVIRNVREAAGAGGQGETSWR